MNRSRRLLAAALAVVALVGVVTLANAASLPVSSASLTAVDVGHPCSGTATATAVTGSGATYSAVRVTLPAGCANRQVTLRMTSGTTTLTGTGQVDASNVALVSIVPSTTYNATLAWTILATVDGWNLPTTWSFTLPPIWCTVVSGGDVGATCTATVALFYGTKPGGGTFHYYDVVVTTTSTMNLRWEVGFNLNNSFYGGAPDSLGNSTLDGYTLGGTTWNGTQNDVTRQSVCSAYPGTLTVRGENNWSGGSTFREVAYDRERRFSLVLDYGQGGYDDVVTAQCSP